MQLIEKKNNKIPFSEIKYGDFFRYEGDYYIKVVPFSTKRSLLNPILSLDGHIYTFGSEDADAEKMVEPVYGSFVIGDVDD